MADISLCADAKCPSRGKCYRYLAIPAPRQSYLGPSPREDGWSRCDLFRPVTIAHEVRHIEDVEKRSRS